MNDDLAVLLAERTIERVLSAYARGIDRLDLESVRRCYWPDATDDHGGYRGGVDGFIEFVRGALARFERTNHFLGNCVIDVDLAAKVARAETYCVAYHRYQDANGDVDMTAGLRYVDRFERRFGQWRIARRVCAYDWRRIDPVDGGNGGFSDGYVRGLRSNDDIVFRILDPS